MVTNPLSRADTLTVEIVDPEAHRLGELKELTLVSNSESDQEWKFHHRDGKCMKPPNWEMVTQDGNVWLDPRQQCPLLFKFVSYREPVTDEDQYANVL